MPCIADTCKCLAKSENKIALFAVSKNATFPEHLKLNFIIRSKN